MSTCTDGCYIDGREREDSARDEDRKSMREKIQSAGAIHLAAALGRLLVGDGLLLTHGGDDGDKEVLALVEVVLDLLAQLTVRELNVVLGSSILSHQVEETVIDVNLRKGLVTSAAVKRSG